MARKNWKHLFSLTGYIFLQENVCLTLLPKNSHGITQRPTLYTYPIQAQANSNLFNLDAELQRAVNSIQPTKYKAHVFNMEVASESHTFVETNVAPIGEPVSSAIHQDIIWITCSSSYYPHKCRQESSRS